MKNWKRREMWEQIDEERENWEYLRNREEEDKDEKENWLVYDIYRMWCNFVCAWHDE